MPHRLAVLGLAAALLGGCAPMHNFIDDPWEPTTELRWEGFLYNDKKYSVVRVRELVNVDTGETFRPTLYGAKLPAGTYEIHYTPRRRSHPRDVVTADLRGGFAYQIRLKRVCRAPGGRGCRMEAAIFEIWRGGPPGSRWYDHPDLAEPRQEPTPRFPSPGYFDREHQRAGDRAVEVTRCCSEEGPDASCCRGPAAEAHATYQRLYGDEVGEE